MIKTTRTLLVCLLVIHLLAVLVFVGWLHTSGRISKERLDKTVEIFRMTTENQKAKELEDEQFAEAARLKMEEAVRLEQTAQNGSVSMSQRLDRSRQDNGMALIRLERMEKERQALQRFAKNLEARLQKEREDLEQREAKFREFLASESQRRQDEDFKKAVGLLEALKPKQAKQILQDMLQDGKEFEAVEYLAAMKMRKAAGVLGQFKQNQEIAQATMLVERLRQRGINLPGSTPGS